MALGAEWLEEEEEVSNFYLVIEFDGLGFDLLVVDEGAIGAAEVLEGEGAVIKSEARMLSTDRLVYELEISVAVTM